jgi:small subunit ribosomal protein S8
MGPAGAAVASAEAVKPLRTEGSIMSVVNDPIGDMLTRLRNGSRARHDKVVMPHSNLKLEIIKVLKSEGFIGDYTVHERAPQNEISVQLKYGPDRAPAITGIRRVSKPGLRRYVPVREIPRVLGGMGIAVLSTSKGIMSDGEARKQNLGGELLCTVY